MGELATFRMIHTEFWNDPTVIEEMSPEDKYFFLYLLTNPNTTQVGIYQITKKQMAFDLGYSLETINSLLDRFTNTHKVIKYNPKTREIAIRNWGKYNLNRGGKPMLDCVTSELKEVKDISLISYVGKNVQNKTIKNIYDSYNDTCNDTHGDTCDDTNNDTLKNKKANNDKGLHDTLHDTSDDTGTSRPQYKEEDQEEDQEEEKDISSSSIDEPDFAKVMEFYQSNLQRGLTETPFNLELLSQFYDEFGKDLLLAAMKIAAKAEAKGINFVEGILKKWREAGVKSIEDARRYEMEFRKKRNQTTGNVIQIPNYKVGENDAGDNDGYSSEFGDVQLYK